MSPQFNYPGVYIEEVPSGVRPIAGVPTSVAAFVGYFTRGPLNIAVKIFSMVDFQREFGGLHPESETSYAVSQFFKNGGTVAWVVRIESDGTAPVTSKKVLTNKGDVLEVRAGCQIKGESYDNPGEWGNNLRISVDHNTKDPTNTTEFNLTVSEIGDANHPDEVVSTEIHQNLTMEDGAENCAIKVVNSRSKLIQLVRKSGLSSNKRPNASTDPIPLTGGSDGSTPGIPNAGKLTGDPNNKTGMYSLVDVDIFNILCLPEAALLNKVDMTSVIIAAETFCEERRAFLLIDLPLDIDSWRKAQKWMVDNERLRHQNAAAYFPRIQIPDPKNEFRLRNVGPSGTLAGLYARTDSARGVWKSPAGIKATLHNVSKLACMLTDQENGQLNPVGLNSIRNFNVAGNVAWGARTLVGADALASDWKYISVRRLALFLEESLYRGTQWVVFETNGEPLWAQIRSSIGSFMQQLFRQGAFQGAEQRQAYLVKCDSETTTQADIDLGVVNILVGFAPLKPAEFIIIKIQQLAGQIGS
jgi:Bacteriophage tail sheath protein